MKLSLAIQTPEVEPTIPVALVSGSFEEKLTKMARWGADGVELMTTNPGELDPDEMHAKIRASGLEVSAVASGAIAFALGLTLLNTDPEIARLADQRLYQLIDLAVSVRAPLVTIGSFRGRLASVGEGGRQQLNELLRSAAEYAQTHSVRLVLEPINRFEGDLIANAAEGLTFIGQVNHPALGLLLDTFHVNIEESSWTEPFKLLMEAGVLWHVHLGDNNRLPPGHGLIDFPAIVNTLRESGFTGYLSAELLAVPDPDTAAQQTLEYMRPLLEGSP